MLEVKLVTLRVFEFGRDRGEFDLLEQEDQEDIYNKNDS